MNGLGLTDGEEKELEQEELEMREDEVGEGWGLGEEVLGEEEESGKAPTTNGADAGDVDGSGRLSEEGGDVSTAGVATVVDGNGSKDSVSEGKGNDGSKGSVPEGKGNGKVGKGKAKK